MKKTRRQTATRRKTRSKTEGRDAAPLMPGDVEDGELSLAVVERQTERVRRICMALEGASERASHGEPTWFVGKRVFAMMSTDHHGDGRLAVMIPLADGVQEELLKAEPEKYYYPQYVGVRGWIGVHVSRVTDAVLRALIEGAWGLVAPAKLVAQARPAKR